MTITLDATTSTATPRAAGPPTMQQTECPPAEEASAAADERQSALRKLLDVAAQNQRQPRAAR